MAEELVKRGFAAWQNEASGVNKRHEEAPGGIEASPQVPVSTVTSPKVGVHGYEDHGLS